MPVKPPCLTFPNRSDLYDLTAKTVGSLGSHHGRSTILPPFSQRDQPQRPPYTEAPLQGIVLYAV
jgi:hypothetical protein